MFEESIALEQRNKRWVLVAWCGLAFALVFAFVFLAQTLWRVSDILEQRKLQTDYFQWLYQEIQFDLSDLHEAVERAEVSQPGDPAFDDLRRAFDVVRGQWEELRSTQLQYANPLGGELKQLLSSQTAFIDTYGDVIASPDSELLLRLGRLEEEIDDLNQSKKATLGAYMNKVDAQVQISSADFLGAMTNFGIGAVSVLSFLIGVSVLDGVLLLKLRHKNNLISRVNDNLRAVVEASRDASVILNAEGRVVALSRSAEKMFGVTDEDGKGQSFTDFIVSEAPVEEMQQRIGRWLQEKANWFRDGRRLDLTGKRKDGTTFPVEVGFGFLRGVDGGEMLIASISDVTEQTEREFSLMQARNEALQAERAKSRFVSSMSHEMRTPLNGVLASIDLMRETTHLNERQRELAGIIERCGDDALEQVENVLELTRLNNIGNAVTAIAPFAPVSVLRELIEHNISRAQLNSDTITLETDVPGNFFVDGCVILFRQIMKNLISNAIKFTRNGDVTVSLTAVEGVGNDIKLRAAVADTGVGIRSDDLDRIFKKFETIRESYTQFKSGSGIGLSIVKHSAELMNGKVKVQSTAGKGSEFVFEVVLPRVATDDRKQLLLRKVKRSESVKPSSMDVLVVEDNQINRRMLVDMLHAKGHRVAEAADGLEGVSLGRERAFDLILMDISMPKLDGVGATRMLREFGKSQKTPIVAVTAHAQPENIKEFLGAGMDRVLTKPLRMNMLDQLIEDFPPLHAASVQADEGGQDETRNEEMAAVMIDNDVFNGLVDMLDVETLSGYLDQFEQDAGQVLPLYLDAVQKSDFTTARAEAHRCAGGAAVIGASEVHAILQGMTHAADAGDAEKCRELAQKLPEMSAQTMKLMQSSLT